jgi:hypothetical protein
MTRYFGGGDPQINMDNSLNEINARQRRMEQRQTRGYTDEDVTGAILGLIITLPFRAVKGLIRLLPWRAQRPARRILWITAGALVLYIVVIRLAVKHFTGVWLPPTHL